MTDMYTGYYEQSYPPSLYGGSHQGGNLPPNAPPAKDLNAVVAGGAPAVVTPTDAAYVGIAALRTQADNLMVGEGAWTTGQYANLIIKPGDTTTTGPTGKAWWDGSTWQTGDVPAPAPAPDPAPDDEADCDDDEEVATTARTSTAKGKKSK